ncbi:MAG: aminoacyl-histidine dipeptidase [Defluviitaleaceae bacterium]|nr:aminoacyl-histidine dipeptidase [Defluviitaleaceae bacterium]
MSTVQYEPKEVLNFFEKINQIPRGSGNEKAISDYLVSYGKEKGFVVNQDEALNVIIYKPGSPGKENDPPLILQSHMDMVCEKNADTVHNFLTDPIVHRIEGDFLYANGTTLGADNGVGMALSLAMLDSEDAIHPPLEVTFTAEEETTMKGIAALDPNLLKARRMINMDSGNDTTFCVGCAGGGRVDFTVPVVREPLNNGMVCSVLTVRGLLGGHSGGEIHLGKANSIRTLGRALTALKNEGINFKIVSVSGGLKANAIPREADAIIALNSEDIGKANQIMSTLQTTLRLEYRIPDPGIALALIPTQQYSEVFTTESAQKVINAMLLIPYGVLHMSYDIPGLVETSNNVGVMETTPEGVSMDLALRSSVPTRRLFIRTQIEALAESIGAKVTFSHGYPSWTYNPDSPLLAAAISKFVEIYQKDPNVEAVHAGLECGFMMEKFPSMDIVSYCCKIYDAHTPNEHLSISSLERVWKYTQALLASL